MLAIVGEHQAVDGDGVARPMRGGGWGGSCVLKGKFKRSTKALETRSGSVIWMRVMKGEGRRMRERREMVDADGNFAGAITQIIRHLPFTHIRMHSITRLAQSL